MSVRLFNVIDRKHFMSCLCFQRPSAASIGTAENSTAKFFLAPARDCHRLYADGARGDVWSRLVADASVRTASTNLKPRFKEGSNAAFAQGGMSG